MKKLLSFLAVAAIVTSAFAFSPKVIRFCVKNAAGTGCQVINRQESPTGLPFTHFPRPAWDGTNPKCVQASPITDCVVPIVLDID